MNSTTYMPGRALFIILGIVGIYYIREAPGLALFGHHRSDCGNRDDRQGHRETLRETRLRVRQTFLILVK